MKNILIIDDDKSLRLLLKEKIEKQGYNIIEASNGKEGIDLYHKNNIDLIITDLIMPEKEGIETIIELRKENSNIKIIAISGGGYFNPEDYLEAAEGLGAIKTFMKPIKYDKLIDYINKLLKK